MEKNMLEILACPIDGSHPLDMYECISSGETVSSGALYCTKCGRFYPIIDGIPVMLPDELRDRETDLEFLRKNAGTIPENVRNAAPYGGKF